MLVDRYKQTKLHFNFKNKDSKDHLTAIGDIVERVVSIEQEGIIVFLQSYKYLQTVREALKPRSFYKHSFFDGKDATNIFESYQQ